MNYIEIPELGKRLYIPRDLSECDERQYCEIAVLLHRLSLKEIDYVTWRILGLYALLDMKQGKELSKDMEEQKNSNIFRTSELLDSFFEEVEGNSVVKQYYVHNPIPKVVFWTKTLSGPKDGFEGVKFGQYVDGLNFFHEYHVTKDKWFLYLLMATFYLEKGRPYNENRTVRIAEKLSKWDFGKVYGFYLLFASFQKYLATAKMYWMGKEISLGVLFEPGKERTDSGLPDLGLKSIMYSLAESGVFGPLANVRKEDMWEVLFRMYDIVKRDRDFEAQREKEKSKQS